MPPLDTSPTLQDAKRWLAALLDRCQPLGMRAGNTAVMWTLSGMRQLIAETAEPLRLPDCLILAGVLAHLLEAAMRHPDPLNPVPRDLADAHRDVVSFMERCAWAAAAPPPPETSDPRVDRALRYLREHYTRPDLTMNDAARHVGLSRQYLARLLAQHTGRGFPDHLHDLRIREARRLLVVTTLSVKEVAAAAGYNDATQFCRQFRRLCHTSPATFRRAALAEHG